MPETARLAQQAVAGAERASWQQAGDVSWAPVTPTPAGERWVVVRTAQGLDRARATLARKAEQARGEWEQALWHLWRASASPVSRTPRRR